MTENPTNLTQAISRLKAEITEMQRDTTHGTKKPHKLVMLLAVIDLYEKGIIYENKIPFDTNLTDSFSNVFNLIRAKREWNQPAIPYFHLRTSNFWHHKVKPGRESAYAKLTTSGGGTKRIHENIEYAYLSEYCFQVMGNNYARQDLKEFLISALNPYANFSNAEPKSLLEKRG